MSGWRDEAARLWAWACALGLLAGLAGLLAVLLREGAPAFGAGLLFGDVDPVDAITGRRPVFDGIWPAVAGTGLLVGLALVLAVPVGVGAGLYLDSFARPRTRRLFELAVDVLAGVPSIVMGLFGFALILLLRATLAPSARTGLLLSSACLGLLVLPYLVRTTQGALAALPTSVGLVGPSLGFTRWQALRWIRLPAASRGILGGVVLAVGRAAEDTAVIMLTGAVWNAGLPAGLFDKYEALPFRIYVLAAEYRTPAELAQGFAAALVLLLLTTSLLGLAWWFQRSLERRWKT